MTAPLRRLDDLLLAPGTSRAENALVYATGLAGTVPVLLAGSAAGMPVVSLIVLGLLALDLFGGAVANALPAVRRRFHRPGRTARHHLAFVAAHLHLFVLALIVPGVGWATAAVGYALTVLAAAALLACPSPIRRPLAACLTVLISTVALTGAALPPAAAWAVPTLLVKLLLGHLLTEEEAP